MADIEGRVTRVLVVDDHEVVRVGVAAALTAVEGLTMVGDCSDGVEVLAAARRLRPDVVVMDLEMPRVGGIEATRWLREVYPAIRVVVFSSSRGGGAARATAAAGAVGYVHKNAAPARLVAAIRAAAAGGGVWDTEQG